MKDDKVLYKEFLTGNENAYENLIMKYKSNLIFFICRYVKNIELAEDIFQDVVMYIYENKEKYNSEYKFKTYIYMIAKCKALDVLKNKKNIESFDNLNLVDERNLVEEKIITMEKNENIKKALLKLPNDYQLVLHLTKFEELSYKDTALIMNKNEEQIRTLAHNAKKKLRNILIQDKIVELEKNKIIMMILIIFLASTITTGIVYASYKIITSILPKKETFTLDDLNVQEENIIKEIDEEQALNISNEIVKELNIIDNKVKTQISLVGNPLYSKIEYKITYGENQVLVFINGENGKLESLENNLIKYKEDTIETNKESAEKIGIKLYKLVSEVLEINNEYNLYKIEKINSVSNIWKIDYRKYYNGLVDENDGIRIVFDIETEKIKGIYNYSSNFEDNEIIIDKENALKIAKDFANANNIDTSNKDFREELSIELVTRFSDNTNNIVKEGEFIKESGISRRAWRIYFGDNKISVDCTTGEIISVSIVEE